MNDDAIMKFIMLVEVHFPRPKFSGDERREALWMRSMSEILADYDARALALAAETIIRTRDPGKDSTMFPKPSECIRACDAAKRLIAARDMPLIGTDYVQQIQTALPEHVIARGDVWWEHWLEFFRNHDRADLARDAEQAGRIRASSRYPKETTVVFEPRADKQHALRLETLISSYRSMPN